MKPKDFLCLAVAGLLTLAPCYGGADTNDQLQAALAKITETRDSKPERGSTQIVLTVSGPAAKRAEAFANFRVDQAADDAGENLVPSDHLTLAINTRINDVFRVKRSDGVPSFVVDGLIRTPSRQATKIIRLVGQVQVMTLSDENQSIIIPKLANYIAKSRANKDLASKKLTLEIGIDNGDKTRLFTNVGGNPAIVRKLQIIDDNGRVLEEGGFNPGFTLNTKSCFFALPRDVDDRMSLKFEVAVSQKVITVPFDFKDIPLP